MINTNAISPTTVRVKSESLENPMAGSSAQSPEYFFKGKGVSPVGATPLAIEPTLSTATTSAVATTGENTLKSWKGPFTVNPATDSVTRNVVTAEPSATTAISAAPLPEHGVSGNKDHRISDLDWRLEWSELDDKITKNLPAEMQILFAIYLGFPIADITRIQKKVDDRQCAQHDYLSWSALHRKDGLIREKLTITHEKLLTMLASISRFDLIDLHCKHFGIAFDQSRFPTQWPPALKTADAALDHPLDLFMLYRIFEQDNYLLYLVPMERIAFAAGYPELMMDQDLQKSSMSFSHLSTMILLKKILDKQEGRMTTNELVKIISHPEIMANSCAHQLIETLSGNLVPPSPEHQLQFAEQLCYLAQELGRIKIPADAIGLALGVSLPISQGILKQPFVDEATPSQLYDLLIAATRCQPGLTPAHILYALHNAAGTNRLKNKLNVCIASNERKLSLFQTLNPEQPPAIKPLYRPDDDSVAATPRSQPLTPDFLCRLPLSHNWFLIGLAMGLSVEELRNIDQKAKHGDYEEPEKRRSIAACYLSIKLAELGKRGVETGHLFQALHYLNDQVTLHYFPEHLSAPPETALPEDIGTAIKQAKLTLELFNTVNPEKLTAILSGYDRFVQMEQDF